MSDKNYQIMMLRRKEHSIKLKIAEHSSPVPVELNQELESIQREINKLKQIEIPGEVLPKFVAEGEEPEHLIPMKEEPPKRNKRNRKKKPVDPITDAILEDET